MDNARRDLDDEPHRRVRRRAVARRCVCWRRAHFLVPAKRARSRITIPEFGNRQEAAREVSLGPPAAGAMKSRAAGSRAEYLRRAAALRFELLFAPQASLRGYGGHGTLSLSAARSASLQARSRVANRARYSRGRPPRSRTSTSSSGSERPLPMLMSPPRRLAPPRQSPDRPLRQFARIAAARLRRSAISRSVRRPSWLTTPVPMPTCGLARPACVDTSVAPLSMFR